MSCGKDNRTMMWDLMHLQCVYDLPNEQAPNTHVDTGGFGALAANNSSKRHNICWSPCLPSVVSTCSFDRRIQFYSLSGARSKLGRAPKWLQCPVGASFGFGGRLVSFSSGKGPDPSTKRVCTTPYQFYSFQYKLSSDIQLLSATFKRLRIPRSEYLKSLRTLLSLQPATTFTQLFPTAISRIFVTSRYTIVYSFTSQVTFKIQSFVHNL